MRITRRIMGRILSGLLPLLFETSRQAQNLIPLALSICFGITASTVLVLVVP